MAASLFQHNGCSGAGDSGLIFNENIKWNDEGNIWTKSVQTLIKNDRPKSIKNAFYKIPINR